MSETEVTTEVQFENSDDLDAFSEGFFGQKPAESAPTKVEAEQEQEPQEEVETQAQEEDQPEDEVEVEEAPKPKKKTVQERIDEVVRQREELRRESEAQMAQLRAEIEALKKGTTAPDTAKASEEPKHDAVNDKGEPIYPLGEFDPQYIRDLTRHTLSQERERMQAEMAESQRQAAVQQEQQTLQSAWNTKVEEATKQYPDLVEKGQAMLANFNNLDPAYAGYLSQVLMQMEKGPDVLYYLSNHPDEAISIVNSGAQKATIALGRIEARFMQSEETKPAVVKVTKAPPPPVARARGANGAFISVAPDTDDLEAFEREFFKPQKY